MDLSIQKTVQVNAKLLKLFIKVRDEFSASLVDQDGAIIHDQDDGYVPSFMPGDHHGDYLILDIDIDTGQITNWKEEISADQVEAWIKQGADE